MSIDSDRASARRGLTLALALGWHACACASFAAAADPAAHRATLDEKVDAIVREAMHSPSIPCVCLGVMRDGRVARRHGAPAADLNSPRGGADSKQGSSR